MKFRRFFLYDEDGGGCSVGSEQPIDQNLPEGESAGPKAEIPAWFSQLSPELREDKAVIEAYGGFKTIGEAVKGGLESRKTSAEELAKARKAAEGMIKVPNKDSSDEELKAFFKALGVPERKEDYVFEGEDKLDEHSKSVLEAFKEIQWKNGQSARQAEANWAFVKALSDTNIRMYNEQMAEAKKNFDADLADLYKDKHSSDVRRQDDAREAVRLMGEFCRHSGTSKALIDSGLMYNAQFVRQFTDWYRVVRGGINFGQSSLSEPRTTAHGRLSYGKEWNDYVSTREN